MCVCRFISVFIFGCVFVSLECEHARLAYVCGPIHPVGKAAVRVHVCERVCAYLCVL